MNDVITTLIALSGDENVLVVRRPFVEFTGSLEAGMLLGQLLYWTGKGRSAEDGFVAKTDKQWALELYLSPYALRQARANLEEMGVLETKVKRWQGSPTVHYRILQEALTQKWILWIRKIQSVDSQNPPSETTKTRSEITSEIISKTAAPPLSPPEGKETAASPFKEVCNLYHNNIGLLSPILAEKLQDAVKDYPHLDWWQHAFQEAALNNVRKLNYVLAVVENASRNGIGARQEPGHPRNIGPPELVDKAIACWRDEHNWGEGKCKEELGRDEMCLKYCPGYQNELRAFMLKGRKP